MSILFSRESDDWSTPEYVYDYLNKYYKFDFDPCPLRSTFDGLIIDWGKSNFVNPPYSNIKDFVDKAIAQNKKGKTVVMLIPARTDTLNFLKLYEHGCNFEFIVGRLAFSDRGTATFPSVIVELIGDGINRITYIKRDDMKELL